MTMQACVQQKQYSLTTIPQPDGVPQELQAYASECSVSVGSTCDSVCDMCVSV